jgi:hypothetical protein
LVVNTRMTIGYCKASVIDTNLTIIWASALGSLGNQISQAYVECTCLFLCLCVCVWLCVCVCVYCCVCAHVCACVCSCVCVCDCFCVCLRVFAFDCVCILFVLVFVFVFFFHFVFVLIVDAINWLTTLFINKTKMINGERI